MDFFGVILIIVMSLILLMGATVSSMAQSPAPELAPQEAERIINAYGALMMEVPGLTAVDSSRLPEPKSRVKQALQFAISKTSDPTTIGQLQGGLLDLAFYQSDLGKREIALTVPEPGMTEAELRSVAKRISVDDRAVWRAVLDEYKALLAELSSTGDTSGLLTQKAFLTSAEGLLDLATQVTSPASQ